MMVVVTADAVAAVGKDPRQRSTQLRAVAKLRCTAPMKAMLTLCCMHSVPPRAQVQYIWLEECMKPVEEELARAYANDPVAVVCHVPDGGDTEVDEADDKPAACSAWPAAPPGAAAVEQAAADAAATGGAEPRI
eukprot:TRINITY_DN217_c0_g3_i1.p5 TRINITY_DN217_c0_g3~~TRINITY_DN217_c0_g3_i1.p5  ORF type:complete len:134 (-),score=6.82 TRINITY_DN217_c0_g3_i1:475-876(-)